MLHNIPNTVPPAYRLAGYVDNKKIHIQVLSATPGDLVRIAADRQTLEVNDPFGGAGGKQITQGAGETEQQWTGEVWAAGVPGNARGALGFVTVEFDFK